MLYRRVVKMLVPTLFGNDVAYIALTKIHSTRTVEKLKPYGANRTYDAFLNNETRLKEKSVDVCNRLL